MKKDYYREVIEKDISNGEIAGASLCVSHQFEKVYEAQFGYQNIEEQEAMKNDTLFRLYSMTKPITAVAIMMLLERGKLDLLEPVSKYIEGFKGQMVAVNDQLMPVKNDVTIRDLLNMTSGVVYPGEDVPGQAIGEVFSQVIQGHVNHEEMTLVEIANAIGQCPLAFEPSTKWQYGASADVLGAVVEVASGMKFSDFLKAHIFQVLGMVDTDFYVPEQKWHRFAQNYRYDEKTGELKPYRGDNLAIMDYKKSPLFESGGAGLVSTIDDYLKFATMLLGKGKYNGQQIIGSKTVDLLTQNQLTQTQKTYMDWPYLKGYGYGNCMRIMEDPGLAGSNGSVGEYGWDGWTGNYCAIDPVEKLIILYFIQRVDSGTTLTARKLKGITYGQVGGLDEE